MLGHGGDNETGFPLVAHACQDATGGSRSITVGLEQWCSTGYGEAQFHSFTIMNVREYNTGRFVIL